MFGLVIRYETETTTTPAFVTHDTGTWEPCECEWQFLEESKDRIPDDLTKLDENDYKKIVV